MIGLTLAEVAGAVGGSVDTADADSLVSKVVIDSREATAGALFIALEGERVDGHDFVRDALSAGAAGAIVREGRIDAARCVGVADPMTALGALAAANRDRLKATVVAITGSAGKTSAKDLTAAAIAAGGLKVVATKANRNNEIGVPLTILDADERTEALVVEVGSRGPGHIAALMPMVRPDISVVLNIGHAHAGEFGSLEVTARSKAELVEGLGPSGVAIVNADDERTAVMAPASRNVVTFGTSDGADVRASEVSLDEAARARFRVEHDGARADVHLTIPGEHTVSNALAAIAAARVIGVKLSDAARAVGEVPAPEGRLRVVEAGGRTVIDDAYNASPDSMKAALKVLRVMGGARPTVAVLGEMAELGERSGTEHDAVGRLAARLGVGRLIVVGRGAKAICEAARLEGMPPDEATWVADVEAAMREVLAVPAGSVILVKASHSAHLERVVQTLVEEQA